MSHPRVTRGVAALAVRVPGDLDLLVSVLVKFTADGCDAMRPCGASRLSPVTRPSYNYFCAVSPYFQACFYRQPMVSRERRAYYIAGPPQLLQASHTLTFGSTFHILMGD